MNMTKQIDKRSPRTQARVIQILDAATACFVEQGFHGTGMARIAERAEMSAGHIYHYFDSKDAIIAAIVERETGAHEAKMREFQQIPRENLKNEMVARAEEGVRTNTDPFRSALSLEIVAEAKRNPDIAEMLRRHDVVVRTEFARLLREKLNLDHAEGRVEALFTLFDGLAIRMLRHPDLDQAGLTRFFRQAILAVLED
jgi:TetR/AcrR family transcriptional regulator, repressor for uid operon|tara:strand:- start:323 stop:919 length:597 start_codon:yes stop_codon:yes gene_type:complete